MEKIEIILFYRKNDFEEIFFSNGQGNLFFSTDTKNHTISAIVVLLVFLIALMNSIITNTLWGITIPFIALLIFVWVDFVFRIKKRIIWKKSVKEYLNEVGKFSEQKIILSDVAFSLIRDKNESIVKWTEFKKAEINDIFISLIGEPQFLIPKESMLPEEFEILRKIISEKLKTN